MDKAEALRHIVEGHPVQAVKALTKLLRKHQDDGDAALYFGWAQAANHNHKLAAQAFTKALKRTPNRIPALYGLGRAHLALGNIKKAREAFKKTPKRDEKYTDLKGHIDHLGALVGYYQAKDVARFSERESLFLEVTRHKDAKKADPRAVSLAWSLAGNHSLRTGFIDEAKQRFDNAIELYPPSLEAKVGHALADIAENRNEDARKKLTEVLKVDPTHLDGTLALAEVAAAEKKLDEAQTHVDVILKRNPPLENKADLARAYLVQGAIYQEAEPTNLAGAIAEYEKAVALVRYEDDVRPTLALANAFSKHEDPAKRERVRTLLDPLESRAADEYPLAVNLGLAWMSAGKPEEAEKWFRTALKKKENDIEARFQLGLAHYRQQEFNDATREIETAYRADEGREDIGLKLASIYEELATKHGKLERDENAAAIYKKLLEVKGPSLNVRAQAGRFYARKHNWDEVRTQAEKILEKKPNHPAGKFLHGEILVVDGHYEEAVGYYQDAVKNEANPQYLDGLGRAKEKVQDLEDALDAYKKATAKMPGFLSPRLGTARIRMLKGEYHRGIEALNDILPLDPKNPWVYHQLGICYQETSRSPQAIEYLKKSLIYDKENADIYNQLGRAYYNLGQTRQAVRALWRAVGLFEKRKKELADTDPNYNKPWVTETYWHLGEAEKNRNCRATIKAWERYLERDPPDPVERKGVVSELRFVKASCRR